MNGHRHLGLTIDENVYNLLVWLSVQHQQCNQNLLDERHPKKCKVNFSFVFYYSMTVTGPALFRVVPRQQK